jgi:hypothetical protein
MSDDLSQSNSLADLAARIRAEHEAATLAIKRGLAHSIAAGKLLNEAKALLKHGQWLPLAARSLRRSLAHRSTVHGPGRPCR